MKPERNNIRILLIDYQRYWREIFTSVLRNEGFLVCPCDTYDYISLLECFHGKNPDLVVLNCTQIGPEEQQLITWVLAHRYHLLLLCIFLPAKLMRTLFLQGVDDIGEKPSNPASLITLINETLAGLVTHNGYHMVERDGIA